ncbi:esterase/lipase family protein [Hymenobacter sp. GOD-10R]|uniref:esterase/lipase family protein n=1 Tax=Hymenobacter sp. GOD-10R TaxID=3093922 RepID=UPI002D791B5A|nr:hypothetical protein [Hymenobacter sp. GOD-10R]WRQ31941.1 hypothetical protein SD425_29450 [Hymenobacter sp. GOD-10R]
MEYVIEKDNNKHLIILVHGLSGGVHNWKGSNENFVEVLKENELIQNNFDIILFNYSTRIIEMRNDRKWLNTLLSFFSSRPKEDIITFNVGIESISRTLETNIRSVHEKYNSISFIAHSMGGLVIKSALTWLGDEICSKIKLFISLSVPHIGSNLANIGKGLLGNNPQVLDLQAMGEFTTQLNERFANLKHSPKIIYQGGNQDIIVPRQSAIPPNVQSNLVVNTDDDHSSILLIRNKKINTVFNRIIKELTGLLQPFKSVNIYIPDNTLFNYFVRIMTDRIGIQVDLSCFSSEELNMVLRTGYINGSTVEDFFLKIGDMVIDRFPKYGVEFKNNILSFYKKAKI